MRRMPPCAIGYSVQVGVVVLDFTWCVNYNMNNKTDRNVIRIYVTLYVTLRRRMRADSYPIDLCFNVPRQLNPPPLDGDSVGTGSSSPEIKTRSCFIHTRRGVIRTV